MIKKSLLLTLLLAILAPWAAQAQTTVEIGDGTSTSTYYYYPINMFYHYSLTQQIYTADEIGMAGTISSIAFDYAYTSEFSMEGVKMYMMNVDKETFESNTDMVQLSESDLVWEGTFGATEAGWITIELTTPFEYDGSSNLLVCCYDPTREYPGNNFKFRTTTCEGYKGIHWYSDSYTPDPYNTAGGYAGSKSYTQYRNNIQLEITPAGGPTCPKPDELTANGEPTDTEFSFTIVGGSGLYNIFTKAGSGDWTNWEYEWEETEVNLTGLTPNTAYQVRVQSVCTDMTNPETGDAATSGWKTLSFTTANPCATPTNLQVSDITAESATLSWTAGYQETEWTVKYKKLADAWDDAETITATSPSITLTGLDEFSAYNVRVYNCENYVSANFTTLMACPDGVICIGAGTATSSYLPANNYYKYSLTEQIYTADEIGGAGAIYSIAFYKNSTIEMIKNLDIYMMSTTVNAFTGTSDWIVPTASDLVYSGTVTFDNNAWTTIELDVPFIYDGTSNVVVLVNNKTGAYKSNTPFFVFSASEANQSIYFYQDGSAELDPTAPSASSSGVTAQKNQIRLVVGEPPACPKPTGVTASNVTAHEATITWTSDAEAWEIQLDNETPVEVSDTTTYTFDSLVPETTYSVKVRANCGGIYSEWTTAVSFTTTIACPVPTAVTVSNIAARTAEVSWTSDASNFVVAYKLDIREISDWTEVNVTTNSYTLTDLIPESSYKVRVKAVCGGIDGESQWTDISSFTTTETCPVPTAVTVTNITAYTAVVNCTSGAENFNVKIDTVLVGENVTMPFALSDLEPNTSYTVKVQALCGGEDGESEWTSGTIFMTAEVCPDGMVCIGSGISTSNDLPVNNYYNYSLTEQIYTADEIGMSGAILSIEFYKAATVEAVKDLDIYMVATDKDEFDSGSDFITVTAADLVYSGTVTFVDNDWTTINLDSPFAYDGVSNLAIIVDNNTGGYVGNTAFRAFTDVKSRTLYYRNDSNNPDPLNPSVSATKTNFKNRIRMAIGEPPACPKPTGVTVNYEGGTEATISWTSDAEAWNMRVNGVDVNGVITNPYTLTGLELATTYSVEVQANCGSDGTSEWSSPVSFTTDLCLPENQCEITIELTDSYGDGWNGAYIAVVDVATGEELAQMSADNHGGGNVSHTDTKTLSVCDGREIQFVWHTGSYDNEASYVVYDINGEVIFEGSGAMSEPVNYTVDCAPDPCTVPSELSSTATHNQATLSWTGFQESYNVQYRTAARAGEWVVVTATTTTLDLTDLVPETTYEWKVQGVDCDGEGTDTEWSEIASFTTDAIPTEPTTLDGGYWNQTATWEDGIIPENINVNINGDVIIPANYTAYANNIAFGEGGALTIMPGGQLVHNNDSVVATVVMDIIGYGDGLKNNYYLIASPLRDPISPMAVENMTNNVFDLYKFDQSNHNDENEYLEWVNYHGLIHGSYSLVNTEGYLYANINDVMPRFTGEVRRSDENVQVGLIYDDDIRVRFNGWNLVGNPFVCNAFVLTEQGQTVDFYEIVGDSLSLTTNNEIAPCQGIFVQAESDVQTVTFSRTAPAKRSGVLNMNLTQGRAKVDMARIRFGEGRNLGRLSFNDNSTKLYIPMDGKDYAVVYSEGMGEMPVSFKAESNGTYTLGFSSSEVSFSYLHLIDNMTGTDVDLLQTPNYSFEASTTDYASRFKLVFCTGNAMEDNFAFFSNGSFVINNEGEATLQVIDVTGRIVKSESINGSASVNVNAAAGVYMLRLINGNDVKVQKIVVK